jgi:hypothetical protein
MTVVQHLTSTLWISFLTFLPLPLCAHANEPTTAKSLQKPAETEKPRASINCEELGNQFDFYRRLAMQDKEALKEDLKKKNNQKSHQQKAIKLQLKELEDAQKRARRIHQQLEKHCSE